MIIIYPIKSGPNIYEVSGNSKVETYLVPKYLSLINANF